MLSKTSVDHNYYPPVLSELSTLVDLLQGRAARQPGKTGYTFLADGESAETNLTYSELDEQARAIAVMLKGAGATGQRVLLLYPSGLNYIAAFFGCLYAGAVAVPAYPPRLNRNLLRLQTIVADAKATVALTTLPILSRIEPLLDKTPELQSLRWLNTDTLDLHLGEEWEKPSLGSDTLAFLQYTSGSTSAAKGVMVSHGNLLHNERMIADAFEQTEDSITVGWLPLYHDMGLIGNVLQPLYTGTPCILMSPMAFLQRPFRWLQCISRYRATTSGGPNFAYDLCVNKITGEQRESLDLSSWSVAYNGSEPVRTETLERFAATFEPNGFRRESFVPCYGLAEATLLVSGAQKADAPLVKTFQTDSLERNRAIAASFSGGEKLRALVGCGESPAEQTVVIVDPETLTTCEPGHVGEVWVAGPNVTHGYWNRPDETDHVFHARLAATNEGRFLRTGDLGFIEEGQLFITGRLKDLIIIRGLNHYPQDIEFTAERCHTSLRAGGSAAFAVEVNGDEQLVVVQEVNHLKRPDLSFVPETIRREIAEEHEVQVHSVVLVKAGVIPKTSSGKIQRGACRAQFLAGSLDALITWHSSIDSDVHAYAAQLMSAVPSMQNVEVVQLWLQEQFAARLGVAASEIDVHQPILYYGLDSLSAIEMMHSIETQLGISLPVSDFLRSASIFQLAGQAQAAGTLSSRDIRIQELGTATAYPLSQGQQSLWFMHGLAPESAAYNIARAVCFSSALNVDALHRAFQKLVDRHACLRTTFTSLHGGPVQWVYEAMSVCFAAVDASGWGDEVLSAHLNEEATQPFNLEQGNLLRVKVFSRSSHKHVLLLVAHHIVADFWSLAVLMQELSELYSAEHSGIAATLPPLTRQYTDYVSWQEDMLASPEGERFCDYWLKHLAGEIPLLDLPTDRPRPTVQTYRGAVQRFRLSTELTRRLKALGHSHEATLYMTLLAAYQVLLYRHSGQRELIVGSPTTGRSRAEFTGIMGYFVNPVAMRTSLSDEETFGALLGNVRRNVLSAFENQDCPFSHLVERLQLIRDPARSPLFQTMFILQKAPFLNEQGLTSLAMCEDGASLQWAGYVLEVVGLEQRATQFDLTLMMAETAEGLTASFEYNTDLFNASTIERLGAHFNTLLESIVGNPEQRISELEMLDEAERQQLLVEFNDTSTAYPQDVCLHQLFEQQVERTPAALALSFADEHLTYAELNGRANQLAHYLQGQGVELEDRVGVLLERSVEMVVALLAILKTGAAYVPLDPSYPAERLCFMSADARLRVLLTDRRLLEQVTTAATVLCLERDGAGISAQPRANLERAVPANALAYVIYTSGSTGQPKGAMNTHGGIVNRLRWMQDAYQLTTADRVLQKTPFSFDVSVWEFFWPLVVGAGLCVAVPGGHQDAGYLRQVIAAERITTIHFVPSMLQAFVQEPEVWRCGQQLQRVICSGEALGVGLQERFFAELEGVELHNLYGPTEAAVDVTSWECRRGAAPATVPIGRPIANTQVYILGERLELVALGVRGEVYLGGEGLARGYLHKPELTAERFIPHPYSAREGARLYRTGDIGRYLADGNIEYLGRADYQVKLRGYRIELGEIENVLSQHPQVREAVVVAQETTGGGGQQRLVGYVVPEAGAELQTSELRQHLAEKLPEHMIPALLVQLEELPLTPNGKVDRRALPGPDTSHPNQTREYEAPRTPYEEALCAIWQQVLGLDRVGIHDNFFELGGHSLLATQVMSRLREAFQVDLPLRVIFEAATVAALAERMTKQLSTAEILEVLTLKRITRDEEMPLSFAQQRLWFVNELEPGASVYNIPVAFRVKGRFDCDAMERSLRAMVMRHESLRTSFQIIGQQPVQVIQIPPNFHLPILNLEGLPEGERERAALEVVHVDADRPFDLTQSPLLRVMLVKLSGDSYVFLATMHHIISDRWSIWVFVKELAQLYKAFAEGKSSPLPPLKIQYADFAHWQRQWFSGDMLEVQLAYWKQQLADAPPVLELPVDYPRPNIQSFKGETHSFALSENLFAALKVLSQRENATLYMTLLACFKVLLHSYTGQNKITVGSAIAGRNRTEVENLIGFFVNMLPLSTNLAGAPTFKELLNRVREVTLEAYDHQDVPFEKLVEELQPARDLSHSPIFQVAFVLHNTPADIPQLPEVTLSLLEIERTTSKFDLTLMMAETAEKLTVSFEYNTDLFDASTIERMGAHFQTLLNSIVSNPEQRISELEMLSEAERHQLLVEFNDTATTFPRHVCIHQLFEQQVERTPDNVALVFEEQRLNYRELNERANQLARHLQDNGVTVEDRVGVLMERSVEMIVSLLAILKVGAAYVPLDPAYPSERLSFMVQDAHLRLLLTQSHLAQSVLARDMKRVCVADEVMRIAAQRSENLNSSAMADNLAYVMYTSGSTGLPKGVMISHRAVVRLVINNNYADFTPAEVFLQLAPVSFDASTFELWGALLNGARLVLMEAATPTLEELGRAIERYKVTTLWLTAGLFHLMVDEQLEALCHVRQLLAGGDVLSVEHVQKYLRGGGQKLINGYGPTEGTTFTCCHRVEEGELKRRTVLIGQPISNTEVYILDEELHVAPVGVRGELYIGGEGLARGYQDRPELTAERFISHPFGTTPGARLYRTGDIARYMPDGQIEFLGRGDHQVKVRGFRVELEEIESVLMQHSQVRGAVVVAQETTGGGGQKRLVGYVVAEDAEEPSTSELRRYLVEKLPEHMIPSVLVQLDELPLTPNGKVDRCALPVPDAASRPELLYEFVEARTAAEQVVSEIWAKMLGLTRVGIHDNFFELGGHSLIATQVISHVREVFEVELSLRSLFETQTVDGLISVMSQAGGGREAIEAIAQTFVEMEQLSEEEVKIKLLN